MKVKKHQLNQTLRRSAAKIAVVTWVAQTSVHRPLIEDTEISHYKRQNSNTFSSIREHISLDKFRHILKIWNMGMLPNFVLFNEKKLMVNFV